MLRRMAAVLLAVVTILMGSGLQVAAYAPDLNAKSVILMEATTGKVLYESNADERLPPASVTKVMTLLLVMEAVAEGRVKLDDMVQVSEYASSMGGSQVYLSPGEEMKAEDLLKSVIIASANDAAVALAEYVAGSEEAFVEQMNERAASLGMVNTHFQNTNGLDDTTTEHYTSARDIAIMSAELLKYPKILEYSSTWMDSIRDGAFGLTNTNRLVRFYSGTTGLKTGSTSKAGFCISATAKRGNLHLIAVIMASPTRDIRNECAKKLLDYGFANYCLVERRPAGLAPVPVTGGVTNICGIAADPFSAVLGKGADKDITEKLILADTLAAPVEKGRVVGRIEYLSGDEVIGTSEIRTVEAVERIGFFGLLGKMISKFILA